MQFKTTLTKTAKTSTIPSPLPSYVLTTKLEQKEGRKKKDHDLIVPEFFIFPKVKSQ